MLHGYTGRDVYLPRGVVNKPSRRTTKGQRQMLDGRPEPGQTRRRVSVAGVVRDRSSDDDQPQGQRRAASGAGGGGYAVALHIAQRSHAERRQIRLWARSMRGFARCCSTAGRCAPASPRSVAPARPRSRRSRGSAHSTSRIRCSSLHRRAGRPMRSLPQRHDHDGKRPARPQPAPDGARGARGVGAEPVPLRHPRPHHPRGAARGGKYG